jgi:hypothetical protein
MRFPLRQVSRIVVTGNCYLHSSAIRACAERGIVIVLHGPQAASAFVVPAGGERERLNERIERFLDRPDAPALYADWKAAAERREIRCFLREARIETTDLRPRSVARLRDAELLRHSDRAGRLPALAGSVLSARAAAWLIRKGVNAQMVETRRRGVCLVTDCGAILTWRSCLDFLAGPPAICSTENLAALLEYRADRDIGRTHALLSSFCHWLGGLE